MIQNSYKDRIVKSFDRAVEYYHEHADLADECADRLIASLRPWTGIVPPGPVLELGCGTGKVTQKLLELLPYRDFEITDLSLPMLNFCEQQVEMPEEFTGSIKYALRDAEYLEGEQDHYALMITGFMPQWLKDPSYSIMRMVDFLKPGGLLLASMPGNRSFKEWRKYCERLNIPFTANALPDTEELVIKLSTGPCQVDYYEDSIRKVYPDAAAFFRHLKRAGAGIHMDSEHLTAGQMRSLIRTWDDDTKYGVDVSYHTIFLAVKKNE